MNPPELELRRRVAALERVLGPGGRRFLEVIGKSVGKVLGEAREQDRAHLLGEVGKQLDARVGALERSHLKFLGVHEPGQSYAPGSLVVRSGSLWHCNTATHEIPGRSSDWQLCVKQGEIKAPTVG